MSASSASPAPWTPSAYWRCVCVQSVSSSSAVRPITPFIGVRISWLMVARNSDLSAAGFQGRFARSLQFLLLGPAQGDVPGNGGDPADVPCLADGGDGHGHRDDCAVPSLVFGFEAQGFAAVPELLEHFVAFGAVRRQQEPGIASHGLRRRVAVLLLRPGVPAGDDAVRRGAQDGVRGGVHDGAKSLELRRPGSHLLLQPGGEGEVFDDDQHLADQDRGPQ